MKVLISEKQFKRLIKNTNKEIDEEEQSNPEPSSGASDNQKGSEGYPEVSTWENLVGSKLTRSADNQIKTTKWEDTVGSKITRGTANPLEKM